jgi:CheY-like chemotaxis protein
MVDEPFLEQLRNALNHLHEPERLRQSPLVELLGIGDRADVPWTLQRILAEEIEALEPPAEEPSWSPAWQIYEPLFFRYVQQLSQREVADQMGICTRHVRRKQRAALQVLADRLWAQFDLDVRAGNHGAAANHPTMSEELAWLLDLPQGSADLNRVLPAVLDLVEPLSAEYRVDLDVAPAGDLPSLLVHPVALRQILISLFTALLPRVKGERVSIRVQPLWREIEIQVQCRVGSLFPAADEDAKGLDMARRLAELCSGRLTLDQEGDVFSAALTFPALGLLPVLAIDDNADTLRLLDHYVVGTPYRLIGTRNPDQALDLARSAAPRIIVLDVMMPQVDGWELLGRLRQHPATGHIPIVVCTILAQEKLALALGADSFVQKPVTQGAFLRALDEQIDRLATESR